jgi:hypothetical protein
MARTRASTRKLTGKVPKGMKVPRNRGGGRNAEAESNPSNPEISNPVEDVLVVASVEDVLAVAAGEYVVVASDLNPYAESFLPCRPRPFSHDVDIAIDEIDDLWQKMKLCAAYGCWQEGQFFCVQCGLTIYCSRLCLNIDKTLHRSQCLFNRRNNDH